MAIFKNMCITEDGMALFAKAQAGTEIKFSKMQVGSGEILDSQDPIEFTKLIDPKLDVPITSIIPNPELKSATIVGNVTNKDVVSAIYVCELGLWAEDPDNGEILYGYANCGAYGDYYAPANQGPFSWQYEVAAAIGNAANVTIELSELKYDYGILNSNENFIHLKGGNLKQINKNIDEHIDNIQKDIGLVEDTINNIRNNITDVEEDIKEISGNLSVNDEYVRDELIDLKLKLKEKELIDTINKTGIGFYDVFRDDSYINKDKTSAFYNSIDKNVRFSLSDLPTVTAQGNYINETVIDIDQPLYVGDKVNDISILDVEGNMIDVERDFTSTKPIVSDAVNIITKYAPPQYLSNGWIVHTEFAKGDGISFRVSKDFGLTWNQLCFCSGNISGVSVTSRGTKIFVVVQDGTDVLNYTFDALTINKNLDMKESIEPFVIDYSQTLVDEGIHLIITPTNRLIATYTSKNAVSKGDGLKISYSDNLGKNWKSYQLIAEDNVNSKRKKPWMIFKEDGMVSITYGSVATTGGRRPTSVTGMACENLEVDLKDIKSSVVLETSNVNTIENLDNMIMKIENGIHRNRLVCVWNSINSAYNLNNHVKLSYSDDSGETWSTPVDLTPSDQVPVSTTTPFVCQNDKGKVYIMWSNASLKSIRYTETESIDTFKENTDLITGTSSQTNPILMNSVFSGEIPFFIWRDTSTNSVKAYGKLKFKSSNFKIILEYPITVSLGERLILSRIVRLNMLEQDFDKYNNINLSVYSNSNRTTLSEDVIDSKDIITNTSSRELKLGDSVVINGRINTINDLTSSFADESMSSEIIRSVNITSNNAPPMYLKNKWIVTTSYDTTKDKLIFMISKDLGLTWEKLTEWNVKKLNERSDFAVCSKDNVVYATIQTGTGVLFTKFDVSTVNTTVNTISTINGNGTERGISMAISDGGVILVAFGINNNVYVYAVKSVNDGVTWTNMAGAAGVDTISYMNQSYYPCGLSVTFDSLNNPCIVTSKVYNNNNTCSLFTSVYTGGKWVETNKQISNFSNNFIIHPFNNINILCQKNGSNKGRIWASYYALESSNHNICILYSDNNGETWGNATKLTKGTIYDQKNPTLSEDKDGNIYVVWQGKTVVRPDNYNLRMAMFNGSIWGDIVDLTHISSKNEHVSTPVACKNYYDFSIPLISYVDNYKVNFLSKFNSTVGYNITLEHPITANSGDTMYVQDFTCKNGDKLLELVNIDKEKHSFQGKRQYTTITDIKIETTEESTVTALAYSIS